MGGIMFIYLSEDYMVSYYIIKVSFFVATLGLLVVLRMGINFLFLQSAMASVLTRRLIIGTNLIDLSSGRHPI